MTKDEERAVLERAAKPFIREDRYIVIKRTDLEYALPEISRGELSDFNTVLLRVQEARAEAGKAPLCCVVVEEDWPEYEPTWEAIQHRLTEPAAIRSLPLESKESEQEPFGYVLRTGHGIVFKKEKPLCVIDEWVQVFAHPTECAKCSKVEADHKEVVAWAADMLVYLDVDSESLTESEYKIYEEGYDKTVAGLTEAIRALKEVKS